MKRFLKKDDGQAMVELALILPVLLLIIMGIFEFGFMFNNYLTLNNVSREAARYASLGGTDAEAVVRAIEIAPNLDSDQLTIVITPSESNRGRGDSLEVVVTYQYSLLTPFLDGIISNGIPLEAKTVMRVE
ncbi:MAG: pilus assembly protein [Clostridiales bacterium]|nr:pilus assembly protein [Clostridiales bacterium]